MEDLDDHHFPIRRHSWNYATSVNGSRFETPTELHTIQLFLRITLNLVKRLFELAHLALTYFTLAFQVGPSLGHLQGPTVPWAVKLSKPLEHQMAELTMFVKGLLGGFKHVQYANMYIIVIRISRE